jgi:hypothetical protein
LLLIPCGFGADNRSTSGFFGFKLLLEEDNPKPDRKDIQDSVGFVV